MATAAIDAPYLAASFGVPEPTIQSLLESPTVELVQSLLSQLANKAREFEDLSSSKFRAEVELENATRTGEKRAQGLRSSLDQSLKDVEDLRKKVDAEAAARSSVEAELQALKSSSTTSSSEAETLQSRISALEASNRDTLSLLEAKSTAHDRLAEELSAQHQKTVALRREVSELEAKNQSLENASTSTKYREQSLQQEVDLLKRNVEWHESELKTRAQEQTKFRKEKNARIAELERANEDATQTVATLRRSETQLRNRLEEMNSKFEDSLQRIQQLQESAVKSEESFRAELEGARRLVDLQKRSAETSKERLQQVNENLERYKDQAAEEIGELQAQCQTEHSEREAAEGKIAELESQLEKLQSDLNVAQQAATIPGTPRRNGIIDVGTPGRAGSPAFSPGSSRMKGGLTVTQLYTENSQLKSELERQRHSNIELRKNVDEMLSMMETKQPEIEEMKVEHDALKEQAETMASALEDLRTDRDTATREARRFGSQIEGLTRDADLLRQQCRDLSNQINFLLVELQSRDQGLGALSAEQQVQLQQAAQGGLDEATIAGMSDTSKYISKHLVIFKNVKELQDQNQKLLLLTRQIGERLEGDEAKERGLLQKKMQEELEASRERIQRYEDEIKALTTRSESYLRERDMFRRMLSHHGQIPPGAEAMFDRSLNGSFAGTPPPASFGQSAGHTAEARTLLDGIKELQSRFDSFKDESSSEHNHLKEQNRALAKEKSELQGDVAKYSSKLEVQIERYNLLQSNFDIIKEQNGELQKRSHSDSERAAQNDLRVQEVMEELVQANSLAESMRNETANLKAERELWKKIEVRLGEDNRSLMDERSRLNKMITDLQNLQNERELSDSETRRRLQSRVESLESELATTKRKLDEELDDSRKASLRREYEQEQSRTRIDDLIKSLGNVREELVVAKTQRDQLQARVDEMKIELRSAEERVQTLQPRPTARPGSDTSPNQPGQDEDATLTREQDLELQATQLKHDLDLARQDLEQAKGHVEQYRAIAQSSEEELASLNETNDQYREETDRQIAERDTKIEDLGKRVEEISAELTSTSQELSALRTHQEDQSSKLGEQKAIFDAELARLSDEVERYKETASLHQEDKKAQAEIAQQAQQNYEDELVKHAEAARNLQILRTQHNELKMEVASIRAEAEAAKATLEQSKESWAETRGNYERELAELKTRRDDVNQQNRLLHQQLDTVSSQISSLKQNRASLSEDDSASPSSGMENLQEVIRYLRREKEIVDVQYELSIQEARRLQQQLEYAQSQLDQEREKLAAERQKADGGRGVMSHSELMENINKLNLFRESNATLRNEAEQARNQLVAKNKQIEDLTAQLRPLHIRVREIENELETKEGEIGILQKDRDHYQTRVQNILQKYNRVDPEELEGLKNQVSTLQAERDQLQAEKQPMQEKIDSFEAQLESARQEARNDMRERLSKQFKERSSQQSARIREKDAEIQNLNERQTQLTQELEATKTELEQVKTARDQAASAAASASQDAAMQNGVPEDEGIGFSAEEKMALEARAEAAEAKAKEEADRADSLHARVGELESQVNKLQQQLDSTSSELSALKSSAATAQAGASAETIEKLQADLSVAQQELEILRASTAITSSVDNMETDGSKSIAEQVEERVASIRAQLDAQFNERVKAKDEQLQKRSNTMKEQLNTKLREARKEREDTIAALKEEHAANILKLQSAQQAEKPAGSAPAEGAPTSAEQPSEQSGEVKIEDRVALLANLSDKEVKDFIAANSVAKGIISRNIKTQIDKTKQEQEKVMEDKLGQAKTTADQEKAQALAEAKAQADQDKEQAKNQARQQAEAMAASRAKVQVSMAQTKANNAQVKIDFLETAARDTPEKPVKDVWEIAKTMKAQPTPKAEATQGASSATPAVRQPDPSGTQAPQPIVTPGQMAARRASNVAATNVQHPSSDAPPGQSSPTPAQRMMPDGASGSPQFNAPPAPFSQSQGSGTNVPSAVPQNPFAHQQPPAPSRLSGQGFGTGPAALQALANQANQPNRGGSRIPSGASGLPRGSGNIRGRGGVQGAQQHGFPMSYVPDMGQAPAGIPIAGAAQRGGLPSSIPGPGRGRGQFSGRGRGAVMNPGAQQFVPGGNKRMHDGELEEGAGRGGKRQRGGQGG